MVIDIVLIDDNEQHLKTTAQLFIHHGYNTKTISDPKTALDLLIDWNPRLIILDIMMPGMDGFTLLKRIKENQALLEIPVIILSGKVFPPEKRKASQLGADKFLTKPIHSRKLLDEIDTLIRDRA